MSSLRVGHPLLDAGDLSLASNPVTMLQHSREAVLRSLSVLELTLMVSIHHVSQLSEQEPFNFEMVYDGKRCIACSRVVILAATLAIGVKPALIKRPRLGHGKKVVFE